MGFKIILSPVRVSRRGFPWPCWGPALLQMQMLGAGGCFPVG